MEVWSIVVIAILLSIILGFTAKINIGFIALSFAYLVGSYIMDLKPKAIVAMWPLDIFFILIAVSFFYSFATANGTLEKLAQIILYRFRKYPVMLPFVVFLVAHLLSGMGAGYFAVMAFIIPFTLIICEKTGMTQALGVVSAHGGAVSGGKFIISVSGKVMESLVIAAGYSSEEAVSTVMMAYLSTTVVQALMMVLLFCITKQWKILKVDTGMEKPEPLNQKQKINLVLILAMVAVVLGPYIVGVFVKHPIISTIQNKFDISFVAILFSIVALLFKLGDEKKLIKSLPWETILMISGVGILIQLGVSTGLIDALSSWVSANIPPVAVPLIMMIAAGTMSVFSSTTGVVMPTLFPMVPALFAASGVSVTVLFSLINLSSVSTGLSPFSSGGGLSLSSCPTEESRAKLLKSLLWLPFATLALTLCCGMLMTFIFK